MLRLGLVLLAACRTPDDCQRAIDRIERIEEANGRSLHGTAWMVDACRTSKFAAYDPVLRCAMSSASDEAAAACIDRGLRDVVHGPPDDGGGAKGLNPLMEQ